MLPCFSRPKPDELFTSWFSRVAYGNISDPYQFSSQILGSYPLFNVDGDLGINRQILKLISKYTGIPYPEIENSVLSSLVGNYLTEIAKNGHNPQILGCRIVGQIRRQYGQQFCAKCLEEDVQPYFRKQWRLAYFTVCLKHRLVFSDRCTACNAAVNYHKLTFMHPHIAHCYACGRNLFRQTEYPVDEEDPIVWLQSKLKEGMTSGWVKLNSSTVIRTPVFLSGVQYILQAWVTERSSKKLSRSVSTIRKSKLRPVDGKGTQRRAASLDVIQRYRLLDDVAWLLMEWPDRFVEFCNLSKLTPKTFFKTDRSPPYWLYSVFYWILNKKHYWTCLGEIMCAGRFLYKRQFRVSPGNIASCVGLDRSMYITRERRRYIKRMQCLQKNKLSELTPVFHSSYFFMNS